MTQSCLPLNHTALGSSSALGEHQIIHPATALPAGLFIVHCAHINPRHTPLYMSLGKQEVMLKTTGKRQQGTD